MQKKSFVSARDIENGYSFFKHPFDYPINVETYKLDKYEEFEAIISENGDIYEVPNGHQSAIATLAAENRNSDLTASFVGEGCDNLSYWIEWLHETARAVSVHKDIAFANSFSENQIKALKTLQNKQLISEKFLTVSYNFDGTFNHVEKNLI